MKLFTQFNTIKDSDHRFFFQIHAGVNEKSYYIRNQNRVGYLQEYIFIADIKE